MPSFGEKIGSVSSRLDELHKLDIWQFCQIVASLLISLISEQLSPNLRRFFVAKHSPTLRINCRFPVNFVSIYVGRTAKENIPRIPRICTYCSDGSIGDESHYVLQCKQFFKGYCILNVVHLAIHQKIMNQNNCLPGYHFKFINVIVHFSL